MNQYGLPLNAPIAQTLIPAMNESGLMYGFYIINTTTFDGTETSLTLIDTTVPLTTVTLDYNPTEPDRVVQYMAAVFSINTPPHTQPWSSSVLIPASSGVSREWVIAAQATTARGTDGVLLTALNLGMTPNLGPAPGAPVSPSTPTNNAIMNWASSVNRAVFAAPNSSFFDLNWKTLFDGQSPVKGTMLTILSSPPSGFRAAVIGRPVDVPANVSAFSVQAIVYETLRFVNMGAVAGTYPFVFRVTCADGSLTTVNYTLTLT